VRSTDQIDDEQTRLWNGAAGRAWVGAQPLLDDLFRPFEELLADIGAAESRGPVLDIGCGTGSTTLAIARRLGARAQALGIDISAPMIAVARARAEREGSSARFICADAQDHGFAPASIDLFVSRFGVMFFADPVRAFANLRRAATHGARLRLIAWRSGDDNPFMTTAERAAAPLLPNLPARQFAFADRTRVRAILEESGWTGIDIQPLDVECSLPESALIPYLTQLGPVGMALEDADASTRERVIAAARPAFDAYVHGAQVRVPTACWMIAAHR
jgi:SAM-dependent methyltransferase